MLYINQLNSDLSGLGLTTILASGVSGTTATSIPSTYRSSVYMIEILTQVSHSRTTYRFPLTLNGSNITNGGTLPIMFEQGNYGSSSYQSKCEWAMSTDNKFMVNNIVINGTEVTSSAKTWIIARKMNLG